MFLGEQNDFTTICLGQSHSHFCLEFEYVFPSHLRNLILLTGSGKVPAKSELLLQSIRNSHPGIAITTPACDVRSYDAVHQLFATAQPPIASVFHAANQYSAEDSTTLTDDQLMGATWDIKVKGAIQDLERI